eukprot:UN08097
MKFVMSILLVFALQIEFIFSQQCGSDCSICHDGAMTCNSDTVNRCTYNYDESKCVVELCGPDCSLCDGLEARDMCTEDNLCVYLTHNNLCRLKNDCSSNCTLCLNETDCIYIGNGVYDICVWTQYGICVELMPTTTPTQNINTNTTTNPIYPHHT